MFEAEDLRRQADRHREQAAALLDAAEREQRHLSRAERADYDRHVEAMEELRTRAQEVEELEARNRDREQLAREITPQAHPSAAVRVGQEPLVYARESPHSFFLDALARRYPDEFRGISGAEERLQRHAREVRGAAHGAEHRDVDTTAVGALVVPQYLPEMYAEVLRAGRVTANLVQQRPLPAEGMTLNIPRGTSGTVVSAQSSENVAVAEADFDETTLVVNVRTFAGLSDVSRQAVERGRGVDEILYVDLAGDYVRRLNTSVLTGTNGGGNHLGLLKTSGVTFRAANTASFQSVYNQICGAVAFSGTNRFMTPDAIVMHPVRWSWIASQTDADNKPIVPLSGMTQVNVAGSGQFTVGQVGRLAGIDVYVDPLLPADNLSNTAYLGGGTQDLVILMRRDDQILWEESVVPRRFRFEETLGGQLTIRLVVAGYSAFTAGWRPEGTVVLAGSAFVPPTFV